MVDMSYTTSGRESRNMYTFVASSEDNGARFRCEAKNEQIVQPMKTEILLKVQCRLFFLSFFTREQPSMKYYNQIVFTFKNDNKNIFFIAVAPESVTITGDDSGKVGDVKDFSCETSNSNPPATIQWVVDGRTVPSTFTTTVSFYFFQTIPKFEFELYVQPFLSFAHLTLHY